MPTRAPSINPVYIANAVRKTKTPICFFGGNFGEFEFGELLEDSEPSNAFKKTWFLCWYTHKKFCTSFPPPSPSVCARNSISFAFLAGNLMNLKLVAYSELCMAQIIFRKGPHAFFEKFWKKRHLLPLSSVCARLTAVGKVSSHHSNFHWRDVSYYLTLDINCWIILYLTSDINEIL